MLGDLVEKIVELYNAGEIPVRAVILEDGDKNRIDKLHRLAPGSLVFMPDDDRTIAQLENKEFPCIAVEDVTFATDECTRFLRPDEDYPQIEDYDEFQNANLIGSDGDTIGFYFLAPVNPEDLRNKLFGNATTAPKITASDPLGIRQTPVSQSKPKLEFL